MLQIEYSHNKEYSSQTKKLTFLSHLSFDWRDEYLCSLGTQTQYCCWQILKNDRAIIYVFPVYLFLHPCVWKLV